MNQFELTNIEEKTYSKEMNLLRKKLSYFKKRKIDKEMLEDIYDHVRDVTQKTLDAKRKILLDRLEMNTDLQSKKDLIVFKAKVKQLENKLLDEIAESFKQQISNIANSKLEMGKKEMAMLREIDNKLAKKEISERTAERQKESISSWTEKYEVSVDKLLDSISEKTDLIIDKILAQINKVDM